MKVLTYLRHPSAFLIAAVLGAIAGMLDIAFINSFTQITAQIFMRIFKLLSLPVICFSLLATLSGLGNWKTLQNLGLKVVRYTILTTFIAASIAAILYNIFLPKISEMTDICLTKPAQEGCSYITHLINIIPDNIIQPFIDQNVISVLIIAVFFGLGILGLPTEKRIAVHQVLHGIFEAIMNMIRWVVCLMPLAVFSFLVGFVHEIQQGFKISEILVYLGIIVAANLIQAFIVLPLFLRSKGIPIIKSFNGMLNAISVAFFAKSSTAAMSVAIDCAEKLNASPTVVRFSFPLCTSINMNACAAFIYITVMFVASSHGMHFDATDYIVYIFVATLAAIGNAGVPMGCFLLASALLTTMGVPLTLMGVILPVYALIDMLETAINIWSDACVTLMVDHDIKNEEKTLIKE